MRNKRFRCNKCGGKLLQDRRVIKCDTCGEYMPYAIQKKVLRSVRISREKRNRIDYLRRKGMEQGFLTLSEAGEFKGHDLLWAWNHAYLFNTLNKPLRIKFDDTFINYTPRYKSRSK